MTPFPQSYWLVDGLLCGGHYPGDVDAEQCRAKLQGVLDCGIRRVLSLTLPSLPYALVLSVL